MAKLSLKAAPTFQAPVQIPVAGGESVPVMLTFKHRTRSDLNKFTESRADKSDAQTFLDMVDGWELDEPFNPANVDLLLESYIGAGLATYQTYIDELVKHKAKN